MLLFALGTVLFLPERVAVDIAFLLVGGPLIVAAGFRGGIGDKGGAVFRFLGNVSYPVYALHGSPVVLVVGATNILHLGQYSVLISLLYVAGVLVVAHLVAPIDARVRKALTAHFSDTGRRQLVAPLFRRLAAGRPHIHR